MKKENIEYIIPSMALHKINLDRTILFVSPVQGTIDDYTFQEEDDC